MSNQIVTLDGKSYIWTGTRWYGATDYLTPPVTIVNRLNAVLAGQAKSEDDAVVDPDELLSRAKRARESGQHQRALQLARRAFDARPQHWGTLAVLSSLLREVGRPREALAIADRFRSSEYPPLLTSRAAALCDLDEWKTALEQIKQVMAIENRSAGHSRDETMNVYRRIKANAPQLFRS